MKDEEARDPRETTLHPRHQANLIGHPRAEQRLLETYLSGRMHHAWAICGPRGIGKATLAYRVARFLFQYPDHRMAAGAPSLHVAANMPAARHISARSHSDLLVVERAYIAKDERLKTEIVVDDARAATSFFSHTAGEGGWRICIVDAADDLNIEAANSLLKIIEEPPSKALFLIVAHQPGRLLPTIRSRCIRLDLEPLTVSQTQEVLGGLDLDAKSADLDRAINLSAGSPGRALDLLGSGGAEIFARFAELAHRSGGLDLATRLQLADSFSAKDSAQDFAIFCDLLVEWTGQAARAAALNGKPGVLARTHDDISYSIRQANNLNLDRRQTAFDALTAISEALKAA